METDHAMKMGTFFESWVQRPFCCELQGRVKWPIALIMWTAWQVSYKKNTAVLPLFGHLVSPMRPDPTFHKCHKPRSGLLRLLQTLHRPLFWCRQTPATLQKEGNALNAFCRSRKSSTPEENAHNARGRPGLQLKKCLESRSPKKTFSCGFLELETSLGVQIYMKSWEDSVAILSLRWSAASVRLPWQYVGEGE